MNEWIYIDILYIIIYGYIYIYYIYIYTYIVCHNVKSIISYTIYCRRSSEFSYITYHSRNIGSPPGVDAALLWEKVAESCLGLRCLSAVGGFSPPLWKMMEWKSDGMMKFPTERKVIKFMFQSPPTSYSTPRWRPVHPCIFLYSFNHHNLPNPRGPHHHESHHMKSLGGAQRMRDAISWWYTACSKQIQT